MTTAMTKWRERSSPIPIGLDAKQPSAPSLRRVVAQDAQKATALLERHIRETSESILETLV